MTADCVEQVLADFADLRAPHSQPELEAVQAALMLEDVFGLRLTDADIDPVVLGDAQAIRALIQRIGSSR